MLPPAIAAIKRRRSGKYALANPGFELHGKYYMVEVDENGLIHELNQQNERVGVLPDDHWTSNDVQAYYVNNDQSLFVRIA